LRAIDTNIVVRILLRDAPAQVDQVDWLVSRGDILVTNTVMIEVEWVLRSAYQFGRANLAKLLESLLEIDGVNFQNANGLRWAIERYRDGADFTDMVHLLQLDNVDSFVTFDRKMPRQAEPDCPIAIEILN
jgi:predicted nucleic-acid-binding protein